MKKGAFTLIEMIVAIAVFSISILLLYGVINTFKKKQQQEINIYKSYHNTKEAKKLIYKDLISEKKLFLDNENRLFIFQSKNSLYGITAPYIAYVLKNRILYRVESYKKLTKDMTSSELEVSKILPILKNCKDFSLTVDKKGVIVFIKSAKDTIFKVKNLSSF